MSPREEGEQMAKQLYACKTEEELKEFVARLRKHPYVRNIDTFKYAIDQQRRTIRSTT